MTTKEDLMDELYYLTEDLEDAKRLIVYLNGRLKDARERNRKQNLLLGKAQKELAEIKRKKI